MNLFWLAWTKQWSLSSEDLLQNITHNESETVVSDTHIYTGPNYFSSTTRALPGALRAACVHLQSKSVNDDHYQRWLTFIASSIRGVAFDGGSEVPYPNWPWLFDPHEYRVPFSNTATECRFARAMAATLIRLNAITLDTINLRFGTWGV